MKFKYVPGILGVLWLALIFSVCPAMAPVSTAVDGTVTHSTRNSITVRTVDNQFIVFTFARGVIKPQAIPVGAQVRVLSNFTEEGGVRQATEVTLVPEGGGQAAPTPRRAPGAPL